VLNRIDIIEMTCTYFDASANAILIEKIPIALRFNTTNFNGKISFFYFLKYIKEKYKA
jgi:hypothetical protein